METGKGAIGDKGVRRSHVSFYFSNLAWFVLLIKLTILCASIGWVQNEIWLVDDIGAACNNSFYKDVWSITGYYVHEFVSMLANKIWTKHLQSTLKIFDPGLPLIVRFHLPLSDPSHWLRYDDYVLPFFSQSAFLWANNVPSWIERLEHVLYVWKKRSYGCI